VEFFDTVTSSSATQHDQFLVSDSEMDGCLRSLDSQEDFTDSTGRRLPVWKIHASISRVADDRTQQFEVLATWDDDWINRGWYVSDPNGVHPRRYQGFGASATLSSLFSGLVLGAVAGIVTTRRIGRSR